jgi:uncharacterized repeat protein (TIGR02543 family)
MVSLNGSASVTVTYTPEFWVMVTAGPGGSVTPASQWVHMGSSLNLNETPSAGYSFVGWTGTGSGSVTTRTMNPRVTPQSPVTELATFSLIPPPLWSINVTATGLPTGVSFTITVGNHTISGDSHLLVTGLSTGPYPVSVAFAYDNASNATRYVPTGWTSTFTNPSPGTIQVGSNGWLNVTFETQYLVTVSSTGPGSVSPAPGVYWVVAGSTYTLTATPNPHYQLVGWVGTGTGAISGTALVIAPVVNAPITEAAQFVWRPDVAPPTFILTVTQTGLPANIPWNATVGSTGASGVTPTLSIVGLNGSYQLVIPPVYAGPGTRYVPNGTGTYSKGVTGNSTFSVSFTKEYLLTVTNSSGGTVSPGTEWVGAGTTVTLTATVTNSTWAFVNWNSSSGGSVATSVTQVTVNAPMTMVATFQPVYPVHVSGSTTQGQTFAIGLFVVILVVGLLVGLIAGRRRSPPETTTTTTETEDGIMETSTTTYDNEPPAGATDSSVYYEGPPS